VADDALQTAYDRVREANARLDALWPSRYENPAEIREAINELNAAGAELNAASEAASK
jgi:hypothetical protein